MKVYTVVYRISYVARECLCVAPRSHTTETRARAGPQTGVSHVRPGACAEP